MTYALSSLAAFGSLGILLGGLGMKTLVADTLATCMTGAVIGIFTQP